MTSNSPFRRKARWFIAGALPAVAVCLCLIVQAVLVLDRHCGAGQPGPASPEAKRGINQPSVEHSAGSASPEKSLSPPNVQETGTKFPEISAPGTDPSKAIEITLAYLQNTISCANASIAAVQGMAQTSLLNGQRVVATVQAGLLVVSLFLTLLSVGVASFVLFYGPRIQDTIAKTERMRKRQGQVKKLLDQNHENLSKLQGEAVDRSFVRGLAEYDPANLVLLLDHPDPDMRVKAMGKLAQGPTIASQQAYEPGTERLDDKGKLNKGPYQEGFAPMIRIVKDSNLDARLRREAAYGLGRFATTPSSKYWNVVSQCYKEAAQQTDLPIGVITEILEAARVVGPEASTLVQEILQWSRGVNDRIRKLCAEALGKIGRTDKEIVERLWEMAKKDTSDQVRKAARIALKLLGIPLDKEQQSPVT